MALQAYNKKRNFNKTKEPKGFSKEAGKKTRINGSLVFVVQQHAATQVHYDFRLEIRGVLKSWAVPKGPSMNPAEKRLAVMVEDHPLDYKDFEGEIPEGSYGAGNVIIWDNGTYHSIETDDRKKSEKIISDGLEKGHISFILYGQKLKGEFALIKIKRGAGNQWLLIKKKDEFATEIDVLKKNKSTVTGKPLKMRNNKAVSTKIAVKKSS